MKFAIKDFRSTTTNLYLDKDLGLLSDVPRVLGDKDTRTSRLTMSSST